MTNHKALESWATEVLDTPSGPEGAVPAGTKFFPVLTSPWHGVENTLADVLSRWAYPASQALADLTKHGSIQDEEEMEGFIKEEKEEGGLCMGVKTEIAQKLVSINSPGGVQDHMHAKFAFIAL